MICWFNTIVLLKDYFKYSIDLLLLQAILIYIILALLLYPHFQYQLNPDGVSYMSIAQKYLSHDYENAINGYWGPLISWLMLPVMTFALKPWISANIVLIVTGLFVIIFSNYIIKKTDIKPWLHLIVIDVISVVVVFFVYRAISPDLLFVLFSLVFLIQILNESLRSDKLAGIYFGITGVGLYLTKSFGFPFFIAIFFAYCLMYYFRSDKIKDRHRIILNFFTGMIVFFLLSGIWIFLISNKYGHLVIGTAGIYNRALTEPNSLGHPMFYAGLIDPPNATATSIWEDVSNLKIKSWSIFDSFDTLLLELKVILRGSIDLITYLSDFSLFSIPILVITIVLLIRKRKEFIFNNLTILLLILLILFLGYAMIAVDPRYLWLSDILILILGAKLISIYYDKTQISKTIKIIIVLLFAVSFLFMPVKSIMNSIDGSNYLPGLSDKLKPLEINGRIASSGEWEVSMYLSFINGWQYFGSSGDFSEKYVENELIGKKIAYYFVWDPLSKELEFLKKYPEITNGDIDNLKIYKLH